MAHNDGITISAYQFFKDFPNEQTAIRYIEGLRWADGVTCPHCNSSRTSRMKDTPYHQCNDCRQKFTVRTGTVFERSHIPLDKWLYAMYILQTARKGASAVSNYPRNLASPKRPPGSCFTASAIACGNMEAVPDRRARRRLTKLTSAARNATSTPTRSSARGAGLLARRRSSVR